MSRSYVFYIGLLAAFWGASYMFIKVANRDFEPATMMFLRLLIASALLGVVTLVGLLRGWSRAVECRRVDGPVLPAPAGMVPPGSSPRGPVRCAPRACGDGPLQ